MKTPVGDRLAALAADLGLSAGFWELSAAAWLQRVHLVERIDRARRLGWGRS